MNAGLCDYVLCQAASVHHLWIGILNGRRHESIVRDIPEHC